MNFRKDLSMSGRRLRVVLLLGLLMAVSLPTACGKKGPLYLPDDANAPKQASQPADKTTVPQSYK